MNTLHDYFLLHTDKSFAAAVRCVREHAPRAVTPRMLQRLEHLVLTGDEAGEYEWGKVRGAMCAAPPPAPPPKGRGDVVNSSRVQETPLRPPSPWGEGPGVGPRTLHKQHSHYHALMVSATTDADRAEYARKIMLGIIPALDAYYDALRAGANPEAPAEDFDPIPISGGSVGGVDTLRRLQSLRTRVSKIRLHLLPNVVSVARKAALEKELEQKRAEIARIESDLSTTT